MLGDHGERFLERCFTQREGAYAGDRRRRTEHLAARFAAKEAVLKALGTGLRDGMSWTEIEVVTLPSGQPSLVVSGRVGEVAAQSGILEWMVSLTHSGTHAMASVIAVG